MRYEAIQEKSAAAWQTFTDPNRPRILVGAGTCGKAAGADSILAAIRDRFGSLGQEVGLYEVGCLGLCYAEPLVDLSRPGGPRVLYGSVSAGQIADLLDAFFRRGDLRPDLALAVLEGESVEGIPSLGELPMMAGQVRVALRNCGWIDPENIDHYVARGGYAGVAKALNMQPSEVIEAVKASGLRGRGGAGFPTGLKWEFCRKATGAQKYMVCNADEGDPGAFMDRAVLESDPHSVIEGLVIAAYAIGASEGYIYTRAEYPLAIQRLRKAIAQAQEAGLLGPAILGSSFSFNVHIKEGAGAFVCGEETALIASIEGKRGMPNPRPPFPAQRGIFGKPTNINNVETLAQVPVILAQGSAAVARYGTEKSRGTKTFALAGKVRRTGLIEVPLGMTLRQIVFDIGGGIPENKRIKAVQTGGPSGGCIPANLLDTPVDYERLAEAGAIMGSGGMVVMDEDTCMVDTARFFLEFTQNESCGKCAPCRLGTRQMLAILDRISSGAGRTDDIDILLELAESVKRGSLCGLGQTVPNPVLTTIRYFRDEYESHILDRKCPAAVCRGLVSAPCKHTCPAGVDVPRYVRCIAEERYADALDVIREKLPLPAICGYVCFHPCETKCRRRQLDDPIAVRALKRFAAEHGVKRRRKRSPRRPPTGKRVAVVGSGPAGLTAAYYLGKRGHKVTIFERDAEPGGTLRTGIPAFRLPRAVIDEEIREIRKSAGVRIRTHANVSSVRKLLKRGYDAVLLAYGAQQGLKTGIEGEDLPQVFDALGFLRQINADKPVEVGKRVVVVGGGSSAMDAARAACRAGAESVRVLYRRTREDMPAAEEEVEEAMEEDVQLAFLVAPVRITHKNGHLSIECVRMRQGAMDRSGRRSPVPIEGSAFHIEADSVIMAVGQTPESLPEPDCAADRRGRIEVERQTLATSCPGVFAAGDVVTGPATVIEAVGAGRRAATAIDRYLGGDGDIDETLAPPEEGLGEGVMEEQEERRREVVPKRSAAERKKDKELVELGYPPERAVAEAKRCLRCDLETEENA
ncbi:MAG: NADH-quinone oxidoreductase subunit NuoF [Kiritimatiellae bacterium]|nr:NADH-quinone oxidoreductase subunit NuoF [Kiritimatiellia bacterium]